MTSKGRTIAVGVGIVAGLAALLSGALNPTPIPELKEGTRGRYEDEHSGGGGRHFKPYKD